MAALCAEFGISRKTGYRILQRYQAVGVRGLTDRSRRPQMLR
jgi:putative transposase